MNYDIIFFGGFRDALVDIPHSEACFFYIHFDQKIPFTWNTVCAFVELQPGEPPEFEAKINDISMLLFGSASRLFAVYNTPNESLRKMKQELGGFLELAHFLCKGLKMSYDHSFAKLSKTPSWLGHLRDRVQDASPVIKEACCDAFSVQCYDMVRRFCEAHGEISLLSALSSIISGESFAIPDDIVENVFKRYNEDGDDDPTRSLDALSVIVSCCDRSDNKKTEAIDDFFYLLQELRNARRDITGEDAEALWLQKWVQHIPDFLDGKLESEAELLKLAEANSLSRAIAQDLPSLLAD